MKLNNIFILSLIASILFVGCGTSTSIVGSYTAPEAEQKSYDNIMVTGLTRNILPREVLENQMINELRKKNVEASHSLDIISENMDVSDQQVQDSLVEKIDARGFDAYITVAVIDKETETTYVPGNATYAPVPHYPHYQTYWGYYRYNYRVVYDPGYYTTDRYYYVEANLYDANTEELVWSVQTRSYDPGSLQNLADDLSKTLVSELDDEELLRNGPQDQRTAQDDDDMVQD